MQAGRGRRIIGHRPVSPQRQGCTRWQRKRNAIREYRAIHGDDADRIRPWITVGPKAVGCQNISDNRRILVAREGIRPCDRGRVFNSHLKAVAYCRTAIVGHIDCDGIGAFVFIDVEHAKGQTARVKDLRARAFAIVDGDRPGIRVRVCQRDVPRQVAALGDHCIGSSFKGNRIIDRCHIDLGQGIAGAEGVAVGPRPAKTVQPIGICIGHIGQQTGIQISHADFGCRCNGKTVQEKLARCRQHINPDSGKRLALGVCKARRER